MSEVAFRLLAQPDVLAAVLRALRSGATPAASAAYAGVSENALQKMLEFGAGCADRREDGEDLSPQEAEAADAVIEYAKSVGMVEVQATGVISRAATAGDWRAAAWLLEHRFSEAWNRSTKVEIDDGRDKQLTGPSVHDKLDAMRDKLAAMEGKQLSEVVEAEVVEDAA